MSSTPSRPFVHLHCHSHYSLLDGASKVPALIQRAKTLGMNALALTDHGNLYGAVEFLSEASEVHLNDSARLAWDCFEHHGRVLQGALEISQGGANLSRLGYDEDIKAAAQVDQFALVPELRRDPLRVEVGAVGIVKHRWSRN